MVSWISFNAHVYADCLGAPEMASTPPASARLWVQLEPVRRSRRDQPGQRGHAGWAPARRGETHRPWRTSLGRVWRAQASVLASPSNVTLQSGLEPALLNVSSSYHGSEEENDWKLNDEENHAPSHVHSQLTLHFTAWMGVVQVDVTILWGNTVKHPKAKQYHNALWLIFSPESWTCLFVFLIWNLL